MRSIRLVLPLVLAAAHNAGAACLLPLLLQLPGALGTLIGVAAVVVAALSWRRPLHVVLRVLVALAVLQILYDEGFHLSAVRNRTRR